MVDAAVARRNARCSLLLALVWSTFLGGAVMVVYYQRRGLSQTEIFLLQSTLAVTIVIGDVPCGHLADRVGLRKVIIAAAIAEVVQAAVFWGCRSFWQFEIALALIGLTVCLGSGSASSLMSRSYAEAERSDSQAEPAAELYERFESHMVQVQYGGFMLGLLVGGIVMAYADMAMLFALQPIIYLPGLFFAWRIVEPSHNNCIGERFSLTAMRKTLRVLLQDNAVVRWFTVLTAIIYAAWLSMLWLFQPKLQAAGVPEWQFTPIFAARFLLTAVLARAIHVLRRRGNFFVLVVLWLVVGAGALLTWLTHGKISAAIFLAVQIFLSAFFAQAVRLVLFDLLPRSFENRTTELSVVSATHSLLFMIVGPLIGLIHDSVSIQAATFTIAAGSLLLGGIALCLLYRAEHKN